MGVSDRPSWRVWFWQLLPRVLEADLAQDGRRHPFSTGPSQLSFSLFDPLDEKGTRPSEALIHNSRDGAWSCEMSPPLLSALIDVLGSVALPVYLQPWWNCPQTYVLPWKPEQSPGSWRKGREVPEEMGKDDKVHNPQAGESPGPGRDPRLSYQT